MKKSFLLPTEYLLISLILILLLHFIFPITRLIYGVWNLVGIIPLCFGIWNNLAADRAFHLAKKTIMPFEEHNSLITSGVFSITLNPMYMGFVAILLPGIVLLLGTLSPYLIVIAFIILMDREFISKEERNLGQRFSSAWEEYKRKVKKWI